MTKETDFKKLCEEWCEKNDFQLNPDKKHTDIAIKGVIENEKKHGLKFCPCQLKTGNIKKDISLLCPCNFKAQKNWAEGKGCWCGLFVKSEE